MLLDNYNFFWWIGYIVFCLCGLLAYLFLMKFLVETIASMTGELTQLLRAKRFFHEVKNEMWNTKQKTEKKRKERLDDLEIANELITNRVNQLTDTVVDLSKIQAYNEGKIGN